MQVISPRLRWLFAPAVILVAAACSPADDGRFDQSASSFVMEDVAGFDTGGRSESFPEAPAPKFAGESLGSFAMDSVTSTSAQEGADQQVADGLGINVTDRLIVRNVSMTIAVPEVSTALGNVTASAVGLGGWVIASIRASDHTATISFRVPAERLDDAIAFLRNLATEVEAETSTSRDVTEEFVDLSARVTNLEATEVQLRGLFERHGDIEQILAVQRELTKVRGDIERLTGQLRLLENTASFSLVTVILQAEPSELATDAGLDRVLVEGETVRFRAEFAAPEGIEDFSYEWDFGDGTPVTRGFSTAPTDEEGIRTTATVVHSYRDERDSPFFATFKITGTGDAGIAEGEDTVQITVSSVPNIQVSAGENVTAAAGKLVTFAGSFTRPEGVNDLKFRWDFGDGLAPFETDTSDDLTTIGASHEYSIDRPEPYVVTLLVTGTTKHGAEVRAEDVIQVRVVPASVWSETVVDLGETARAATRALSAAFQGAVGVGIWALIFSPAWVGAIALTVIFNRRRPRRTPRPPVEPKDGFVGDD